MANYYNRYYNANGGVHTPIPGFTVSQNRKEWAHGNGTDKQKKLYFSLLKFCKDNNLLCYPKAFERPRDAADASKKIQRMFAFIKRACLLEKYWEENKDGEV